MQQEAASLASLTIGNSVQGTDTLVTSGPSQWWRLQPGLDRDQALLDAQLLGEDVVWRSQRFLLALSVQPPLEGLVASPPSPLPPSSRPPAARLSSQSPPPPPQGLAARTTNAALVSVVAGRRTS
ncbi:MAG: hypothetical protein Q9187_003571 [Circinaria calcarea]